MTEIREYRAEDVPQLIKLWTEVFGDKEELPAGFFEKLKDYKQSRI